MKELDSQNFSKLPGKEQGIQLQIKSGKQLRREIIPFIFRMDKILRAVEERINQLKVEEPDKRLLNQEICAIG